MKEYKFRPIGYVKTLAGTIPRHWSISDVEGEIVIYPEYELCLRDIKAGDKIVVIFVFHKSPPFTPEKFIQKPPHLNEKRESLAHAHLTDQTRLVFQCLRFWMLRRM